MPVLIVIPARVHSTRLPNKPLQLLGGTPLVSRVVARARLLDLADRIVVATDSEDVVTALEPDGVEVVMTDSDHPSGTDRVAAVAGLSDFEGYDIVVNLQGDEPFLPLAAVSGAIGRVRSGDSIGTAAAPLDPSHKDDPGRVKVVCTAHGRALYFSRYAIPFVRDEIELGDVRWLHHVGIYAYRREVLLSLAATPVSALERAEGLEQLRALEAGYSIGVAMLPDEVPPGIDTPADLAEAERRWPDFAEATS